MTKLTFDEAIAKINDGRRVTAEEIQAKALQRFIWVAEWHLPGCLSESSSICLTKTAAIEIALDMASGEDGPPRGMQSDLIRYGRSDRTPPDGWASTAITTIERMQLHDIL